VGRQRGPPCLTSAFEPRPRCWRERCPRPRNAARVSAPKSDGATSLISHVQPQASAGAGRRLQTLVRRLRDSPANHHKDTSGNEVPASHQSRARSS
jgi:hypothetical protein